MKEGNRSTKEGDPIQILPEGKALQEVIRIADHRTETTKITIRTTTSIIKEDNYQHKPTKRATKTSPTPDLSVHLTKSNKLNRNIVSAAKKKALVNKITSPSKMIYFDFILGKINRYIN